MSDWPERIPGAPVGSERTRPTVPSPAELAATVREALRIGGMTGKQPHAALDALLAQAEAAEALRGDLIELPKSEGDARAGGNPDASSGIAPAPTRSGEARSGRTPQGRTPAQLADTVLRFGGPTWDERSRAALGALLAKAETAEENDEEIARLEGALDQAHKDYDETKAERDAAEEKNKKLSALIVEQERQYRDERDAAAREAEQERRDWQIRDRAMTDYFADAERRAEEAERAAEQAQEALRHINYEWELNDHVPSQHLAAIARAAGELPMGSQTIRALREAREALRHAAKILRVDNYDRGSRITEALAILDAALTGEGTTTQRHGRDCRCTPCRAEDWDDIDAGLRS